MVQTAMTVSTTVSRMYHSEKSCAPFCTVGCVHRVAQVDELRSDPLRTLDDWFAPTPSHRFTKTPTAVRTLTWMFVTSRHRDVFRHAAQRMFGIR